MSDPRDPFEEHLARELEGLAGGERAPSDLAVRSQRVRRARQRRRLAVAAAPLVAAAGVLLVTTTGSGGGRIRVVHTVDESTTTTEPTTTSTPTTTTILAVPVTPTTAPTTTVPYHQQTSRCFDGSDPGEPQWSDTNWQSFWQTEPQPNDPLTVHVCVDDVHPMVGQSVTMTVTADDPDDVISQQDWPDIVYWEGGAEICLDRIPPPEPQPTPLKTPGHLALTEAHAYTTPGPRTAEVLVRSGKGCVPDPYADTVTVDVPITVEP